MEKFIIVGGNRLTGTVTISGAKNAVLPIMAASIMAGEPCVIYDVPRLTDVRVMKNVLKSLGARVEVNGHAMVIDPRKINYTEVPEHLMRKLRASNLVMGALLGRFGRVKVAHPGGCAIGSRPMDLHFKGFQALGAKITERYGFIEVEAKELRGADIQLDFPSVGATENIMMAATLAKGTTIIRNAAKEPEIVDLQNFLNRLGARIKGAGIDVIRIEGVRKLRGTEHNLIPDRIETGTYMVAAAITNGDVVLKNVIPNHIEPVSAKLREAGVSVVEYKDGIRVKGRGRIKALDIKTLPYPGFPTDMQPQMVALMSIAEGTSIITETIFESRFKHVDELTRMGANIKVEGRVAIVKGVNRLSGAVVEASDLRAGAALVLAGLAAEDATVVENVHHLDRGYEDMEKKLNSLGARVIRVNSNRE
ncbi:UDP-N-acetylglucosamine 1-carboxyvinyltransferase [Calderihabitans maritimus]|uniref:UDP-N-acetylglucosamine 1-carboxyvinyltransferase n=1 Tax=Calderihabitans maritimus TaxID=1246530 RepID=A0A1Z5HS35_9FIRM|nr:UDP-N-acetylglucosamine 1-carboxyvinyltransferase [Calderihabitans maritimus]GAW92141.1 UDP-N-acetylglucosamine enolpyruvyl transferase [Calderihabitans maritimus]